MTITPFFLELRSAYQSEMDDLRFDSEGRDVLRQRLADKRKEINFLVHMMELSPEMVAVIFHQGFHFKLPAVMDDLLSREADEFPDWGSLTDAIGLTPWAQDLVQVVLKQPGGEWFLAVAAGLEYMAGKPGAAPAGQHDHDESDDDDETANDDGDDRLQGFDADEYGDGSGDEKAQQEAGADWLVEQGFDRKD
ncbi:hypothetical protein LP414_05345 [Polaromonas sp. P1(28)-13]|nr:hypothetical protein LP417_24565 [Polaromonas sp. P1-6]UUZ76865.1 hypothetical protein LP414_05345 [Polaromonas sp. P1(28)-13]